MRMGYNNSVVICNGPALSASSRVSCQINFSLVYHGNFVQLYVKQLILVKCFKNCFMIVSLI